MHENQGYEIKKEKKKEKFAGRNWRLKRHTHLCEREEPSRRIEPL
jgi:hypothetical protein